MADAASHSLSDLELVRAARAGDFAAFETLVNRCEKRVYALALRITRQDADAEDVTQNTMLAMLEKLGSFREESSFCTWILRIATNESLYLLRSKKVRQAESFTGEDGADRQPLPHPDFIARWRSDPESLASDSEVRDLIWKALDEIDEKYRLVFLLRDVQGLSTGEAAEALGISSGNVKVRLLRARLMLRERLTHVFGDPASAMPHTH